MVDGVGVWGVGVGVMGEKGDGRKKLIDQ